MITSITLILSLLTLLVSALPTTNTTTTTNTTSITNNTTSNTTQNFDITCPLFPRAITGNTTFNPLAITTLSKALSSNNFTPKLPQNGITLSPGRSTRIGVPTDGGYQICIQNYWFFRTVTIPLSDLSAAVASIKLTCCTTAGEQVLVQNPLDPGRLGMCQDARAVVAATDGSEVKIVAQSYGANCCGMWGC